MLEMSGILHESSNNSQNGTNNTRNDEVRIDMEVATLAETDKVQEDRNKETDQTKDSNVKITKAEDILKPYIYVLNDIPNSRTKYWVHFMGFDPMPGDQSNQTENQPQPLGNRLNYTPESRNAFIRLVFFIVFVMLLITAGFIALVINVTNHPGNDEVRVDMEVATLLATSDRVQEDKNKETYQIEDNNVKVTIGEEILKPYIYIENDIPFSRRKYWVHYVGMNVEPTGDPLDYTPESRNDFIRLVFFIVFVMLLLTAGFIALVIYIPPLNAFFRRYFLFLIIPSAIILIAMTYVFNCSSCARVPPCNWICLVIVLVAMSVFAAAITRRFTTESILYAFIATALVVLVCLCLACSKFDFTKYWLYAVVIGAALGALALVVVLGMVITGRWIRTVHLVILIVLTLVEVVFLTMELQMIIGGKTIEIGEDDYALAAFMLYTSIIDIFLLMVRMIGMFE